MREADGKCREEAGGDCGIGLPIVHGAGVRWATHLYPAGRGCNPRVISPMVLTINKQPAQWCSP